MEYRSASSGGILCSQSVRASRKERRWSEAARCVKSLSSFLRGVSESASWQESERHANDDFELRFVLVPSDSRAGTILINPTCRRRPSHSRRVCSPAKKIVEKRGHIICFSTDRRPKSYFSPKLTTLRFQSSREIQKASERVSRAQPLSHFFAFTDDLLSVPKAARLAFREPLLHLHKQCALSAHRILSCG